MMLNCNSCSKLIPDDSEFCPFCGNKIIKKAVTLSENSEQLHLYQPETLLKRAFLLLEEGLFDKADAYLEAVLNQDPENAEAYLGKLMVDLRVETQEELKDCSLPFDNKGSYRMIMRFGDNNLKTKLIGYIEYIKIQNENARMEGIYNQAISAMRSAKSEAEFKEAMNIFKTISSYKDSESLIAKCLDNAEISRKDAIFSLAKTKTRANSIASFKEAISLFLSIDGWKDSNEQIILCRQKIEELNAKAEAERLEKEHLAEVARIESECIAKRIKKIIIIAATMVCLVIVSVIIMNAVIIPAIKKKDFIDTYGQDVYDKFGLISKGKYIALGSYEQDNNPSNGKEKIEWLVLEVKDGRALVISKYALDCKKYNSNNTNVTWETCSLRNWLNNDFINSAFSDTEKTMIPTVTVFPDKNPYSAVNPGNATLDKVFLLSMTEVNKYFNYDNARVCEPTAYAVSNGVWKSENKTCWWWLRTSGYYGQSFSTFVNYVGDIIEHGDSVVYGNYAVRPAMWIDISAIK